MTHHQTLKLAASLLAATAFSFTALANPQTEALSDPLPEVEMLKPDTAEQRHTDLQASWHGKDVAINGFDVVSFHNQDAPAEGSKDYAAQWDNTTWKFSSAENRDTFLKDPTRWIPQFGGYCPVALARGDAKVGTSKQFSVVDNKLYLNRNRSAQRTFNRDPEPNILQARLNW